MSSLRAGSSSLIIKLLAAHGLHWPGDYELVPCGPILARWDMLRSGGIDPARFRSVLGHYPTGVCVVTGCPEGDRAVGNYAALKGRDWDVVIDNPTTIPRWVRQAAEAFRASDDPEQVKVLVVVGGHT